MSGTHPSRTGFFGAFRNRALGVAFLVLLLLFVWLTYAIFSKSFVAYDDVSLKSSQIGLQLPSRADVKIRGVLVGEVLNTSTAGKGANITLGIYPNQAHTIPANVTARIIPKTLFGEKYVALQVPQSPSARSIRAGDVISEGCRARSAGAAVRGWRSRSRRCCPTSTRCCARCSLPS